MADYKELLRRAIDALPENNGTARRAVYEKARSALVTQLHAIEPPVPPREITQHRLTLEDCIRQVEQEATEKLLQGLSNREKEAAVEKAVPTPSMPAEGEESTPPQPAEEDAAEDAASALDEGVAEHADPGVPTEAPQSSDMDSEPDEETAAPEAPAPDAESDPAETVDSAAEEAAADSFEHAPIEEDFDAAAEAEAAEDEAPIDATPADEDVLAAEEATSDVASDEIDDVPDEAPVESTVDEMSADEGDEDAAPIATDEAASDDDATEITTEVEEPAATQDATSAPATEDELAEQLEEIDTADGDYNASSIDDVIAQARAASGMDAPTPDVSKSEAEPANTNVEAALSSVREVDVDPDELVGSDTDDDDAQAAIDRALMALDREAEGKKDHSADEALMDESSKGAIAVATKGEPELIEDPPEFVEDEQTGGGGGLLVFLGVFILLLGLLGGGTYWAWREGYVNLDPMFEQMGLSEFIPAVAEGDPASDQDTPSATEDNSAPETNVRDVTPDNNASANLAETPVADEDARLTAEEDETPTDASPAEGEPAQTDDPAASDAETTPAADDPATEGADPADTTSPETADGQPAEDATGDETATDGERLPSEDESGLVPNTDENPLNVQDPNPQATAGAQSLLIEEQPSGSGGAVPFSGQTEWTRDVDELGLPTIRATASIPARNLSVDLLIRKNSDEALPASHLIEVNFTVTESFLGGSIASLPGVLMKDQELAQGTTLVGASVRVVDNSFLFAMSGAENDVARNLELLGQNGWMDLPLIYGTGRKAILTLEKGAAGTEIFEDVLAEWAEN